MQKAEYYVARIVGKTSLKSGQKEFFTVTKFEGGDEPKAVYMVVWDKSIDQMLCECPNKRRSAHVDDKHGDIVREWLAAGEPQRAFSGTPKPRGSTRTPYQDDDECPF